MAIDLAQPVRLWAEQRGSFDKLQVLMDSARVLTWKDVSYTGIYKNAHLAGLLPLHQQALSALTLVTKTLDPGGLESSQQLSKTKTKSFLKLFYRPSFLNPFPTKICAFE